MNEKHPFKLYGKPELKSSSLVIAWNEDAGKLGPRVADYLSRKLPCQAWGEMEPEEFFPLGGVSVEDDVAQFPVSDFYGCPGKNLVVFLSTPPRFEWYKFLNAVLDVAEHHYRTKELYTIGAMVSLSAHTAPRDLLALANSPEMKKVLSRYGLARDTDFETPPGQRPTLSSYLLWVARRRDMAAASLWVPVPTYLAATEDPRAWKRILEFLDKRFDLELDFQDLDSEVARQDEKIAQATHQSPELNDYIRKLESNLSLTWEENEKLSKEIEEFLKKRD